MSKEYVMGNQAIALGAIAAGVNVACGYPGTPSSEIIETIAKKNKDKAIHVEWSINEKAANAVKEIAKARKLLVVFDESQALYFDESAIVDITPEARKALGLAPERTLEALQAELQAQAQQQAQ